MGNVEILILGDQSSGKSFFITRLLSINDPMKLSTIPTIGTELHILRVNGTECNLREVGGLMSSQWMSYIDYCNILLYIIDLSDIGSLATTTILFHEVLDCIISTRNKSVQSIPVAVVFNKSDICDPMSQIIFDNFINYEKDFLSNTYNNFVYFYGSSIDDNLILAVKNWIDDI